MYTDTKYFKLIVFYFLSQIGLLWLSGSVFWDDWTLVDTKYSSILTTFQQNGFPWTGHLHVQILKLPFDAYKLIVFISYGITFISFYKILLQSEPIGISKADAFYISLISMVIPFNMAKSAMIDMPYSLCLMLFFLGWYLMNRRKWLSVILFFISFSTQSLLVFFMFPIIWFYFQHFSVFNKENLTKFGFRSWYLIILPFVFFLLKIVFFQPYGFYENYNNHFNLKFLPIGFYRIVVDFLFFILDEKYILILILLSSIGFSFFIKSNINVSHKKTHFIFLGLFAVIAGVFPYLIVGLDPSFFDWSSRHQLLMPFGAALLILGILSFLKQRMRLILLTTLVVFSLVYTNITYYKLYQDWNFQNSLIQDVKGFVRTNNLENKENKLFLIDDSNYDYALSRFPRFYEYNAWIKKATKTESNFAINICDLEKFKSGAFDRYFSRLYNCGDFKRNNSKISLVIRIDALGNSIIKKI